MDKQSTDHKEETLVAMLASFRKEACYHDTFEEDFLRNFHLRKETDQAAHSAWKLLLERLDNYLQNFRGWQWDMDEPSESYVSSTKDKEEILLTEKAVPVSKETIERTSTEVAPTEKPEFTTGDSSYETSAKDNQLKPDSHADKKPVSRVLIEM